MHTPFLTVRNENKDLAHLGVYKVLDLLECNIHIQA